MNKKLSRKIENKKEVLAWSMYDFANQPFTNLVVTFIYGTFFTTVIASNEIVGTQQWSHAVSITAIIVALLSPLMGAVADRGGYRKMFMFGFTWLTIIATTVLYFVLPGEVYRALFWFVIANVGFEMGSVFCNAYLPDISHSKNIGRISGYGWSLGYVGGLIALALAMVFLVQAEMPIFGQKMDNNGVMTRVPGAKLVSMGGLNLDIVLKILPKVNKRKN